MSDYRYFVADPIGMTHTALSGMEAAATEILKAFKIINATSQKLIPAQLTLNGEMQALSFLPNIGLGNFSREYVVSYITSQLIESFKLASHEAGQPRGIKIAIPKFALFQGGSITPALSVEPQVASAILTIGRNIRNLGLSPNIAVRISEVAAEQKKPLTVKPENAVLTVNNHSFYPDARLVFSTWVVKLPPYIPVHGNDYTPPDCEPITSDKLSALVSPMEYGDFKHDYLGARQRILELRRIEINPQFRK